MAPITLQVPFLRPFWHPPYSETFFFSPFPVLFQRDKSGIRIPTPFLYTIFPAVPNYCFLFPSSLKSLYFRLHYWTSQVFRTPPGGIDSPPLETPCVVFPPPKVYFSPYSPFTMLDHPDFRTSAFPKPFVLFSPGLRHSFRPQSYWDFLFAVIVFLDAPSRTLLYAPSLPRFFFPAHPRVFSF